jgi:hypothetical protein
MDITLPTCPASGIFKEKDIHLNGRLLMSGNFQRLIIPVFILISHSWAGYFLSWHQKGELLVTGAVSDSAGNKYDVRIIPGYLSLLNFSGSNWSNGWRIETKGGNWFAKGIQQVPHSFSHLRDYVYVEPDEKIWWDGIRDGAGQTVDEEKYLFTKFMWSGVGATWSNYWDKAKNAQERQSFGWWLAYPWATVKGSVNTALRYTFGTVGAAGALAYGIALRPAYELSLPLLKITGETAVGTAHATWGVIETSWGLAFNQLLLGVATPVSGYAWTTAVGTPLAFIGRAPTPKSADGWWVVQIERAPGSAKASFPDTLALKRLVDWQLRIQAIKERMKERNAEDSVLVEPLRLRTIEAAVISKRLNDSLYALQDTVRHKAWFFRDSLNKAIPGPASDGFIKSPDSSEWTDANRDRLYDEISEYIEATYGKDFSNNKKVALIKRIADYWMENGTRSFSSEYNRPEKFDPNRLIQDETKEIIESSK